MPAKKITDEQIREAAYLMWKEDGEPHGSDQDFWFKAEQALKARGQEAGARKTRRKSPPRRNRRPPRPRRDQDRGDQDRGRQEASRQEDHDPEDGGKTAPKAK